MAKDKSSLMDKIKKNSTLEHTAVLAESQLLSDSKEDIVTDVPLINAALSGELDRGMVPGLLQIVGKSRMFKSGFMLLMLKSFQTKHPDGVAIFYDSEFGTPDSYFSAFDIDTSKILHCPVTDVEMLKFDISAQLEAIDRGDKVFIAIDSLGNLASKKEVEDAKEAKSVADMSRAKAINSLFRIITPHLTLKSLYMVVVNHGYKEIGLFPKTIVGGGEKSYLSSDNIWIIGREQEKEGKEIVGNTFMIKIEKSRYAKEKLTIPVKITHTGGMDRYSGLLDFALKAGCVKQVGQRPKTYVKVDFETGEFRTEEFTEEETSSPKFWNDILEDPTFKEFIKTEFKVAYNTLLPEYEQTELESGENE